MQTYRKVTIALAAAAMVLTAAPAFAQGAGQTQVNTGLGIGVLGGLTFTSVNSENNLASDNGSGFILGIFFGGNRDGRAGLMGEASYVTKKRMIVGKGETKTTYVELPVLLRINTGYRERDKPSLYFLVGPVFDIQIKAEDGANSPDDVYQGLDIGLMFGAGFEVVRIGIEGRYSYGLKSVLATDAAVNAGFGSVKLNTLSIVAKIRFN